jgi:hypothetical protein
VTVSLVGDAAGGRVAHVSNELQRLELAAQVRCASHAGVVNAGSMVTASERVPAMVAESERRCAPPPRAARRSQYRPRLLVQPPTLHKNSDLRGALCARPQVGI